MLLCRLATENDHYLYVFILLSAHMSIYVRYHQKTLKNGAILPKPQLVGFLAYVFSHFTPPDVPTN